MLSSPAFGAFFPLRLAASKFTVVHELLAAVAGLEHLLLRAMVDEYVASPRAAESMCALSH